MFGFKPHHIALSVKNLDKSKQFYDFFGFKTVFDWISESNDLRISHLMLNGIILELFCYADYIQHEAKSLNDDLQITGIKHFGLSVESIEQAREEIIKAGFATESVEIKQGRTGISYFFVKDPDDNFVEIVHDSRRLTPK